MYKYETPIRGADSHYVVTEIIIKEFSNDDEIVWRSRL